MNLLVGKKDIYGSVHCYDIKFHYIHKDSQDFSDRFEDQITDAWLDGDIIGFKAEHMPECTLETLPDTKLAVVDPPENYPHDYRIILGNIKKKAEQLQQIRKSKTPIIAICDFDFLDDVEQYIAAGAKHTIVFKKLIKKV